MNRSINAAVLGSILVVTGVASSQGVAGEGIPKAHQELQSPAAVADTNWSGFYAGVNAGISGGSYNPVTSTMDGGYIAGDPVVTQVNAAGRQGINPVDFTGGGQIGYNWQFGRAVLGLEADLNYLDLNGAASTGAVEYLDAPGLFFTAKSDAHSDWLLTARARIGYAAGNWLLYATGGLAAADLKGNFRFTDNNGALQTATMKANKLGYAVGAGVEWGVTDQMSFKAEYLRVGFGRSFATEQYNNMIDQPFSQSEALNVNLVRLGLNYRFGERRLSTPGVAAAPVYDWSGFYAGVNAGRAGGAYDPITSSADGDYMGGDVVKGVNAAGRQSLNPKGFTGGGQIGYNWQSGRAVVGLEADLNYLHLNGTASTGSVNYPGYSDLAFVITSYAHSDWLLTARSRIGYAAGNWLFYATGGLAAADIKGDFLYTDNNYADTANNGAAQFATMKVNKLGYAVGAGVEWGVTDRLSLKAEYLRVGFGRTYAVQETNNILNQPFSQSEALTVDMVRLGLNYRFGDRNPSSADAVIPSPTVSPPWLDLSNWELEAGTRVWFSSGHTGAPLIGTVPPPISLASRLTFNGLDAISGESFARLDHASGVFIKGFLGAGAVNHGSLTDEDFAPDDLGAYSNTLSRASGHIAYGTADLGYSFFRTPNAKLGAFVGYNYYEEDINAYGSAQQATAQTSLPDQPFYANALGIAEDGHYNALRVGLNGQVALTDRLKLTADVAYLPWVDFSGQDDHNARELLFPESAGRGNGVMIEGILGYDVTPAWNVGVGGRYWAYNMKDGTVERNYLQFPSLTFTPSTTRFNSERYGMFVQSSYKWGDVTRATASSAAAGTQAPMSWTGFYLGGHLGGGAGNDRWSDPFGSTLSSLGIPNVAGYGDTTHGTGPLGGVQIGANWQAGHFVVGAQADLSAADLRGENTCFSGLSGINCMHVVNAISTVTGRVGFAWDRSLLYAKAGAAWTDTTYSLFGNTEGLALGSGDTRLTSRGWVAGAGLEYALTDHWTSFAEYDHVGIGSTTVPFPTVDVINTQAIGVKQSIYLVKMGVNYKFAVSDLFAGGH